MGHYLLDTSARAIRIVSAWSQSAWMRVGELDSATFVPLAHIVLELFSRPLDIGTRLGVGEMHGPARAPPMMRMGCYTRTWILEDAVKDSRARRGSAMLIQRAFRRFARKGYEQRRDARRQARRRGPE